MDSAILVFQEHWYYFQSTEILKIMPIDPNETEGFCPRMGEAHKTPDPSFVLRGASGLMHRVGMWACGHAGLGKGAER